VDGFNIKKRAISTISLKKTIEAYLKV